MTDERKDITEFVSWNPWLHYSTLIVVLTYWSLYEWCSFYSEQLVLWFVLVIVPLSFIPILLILIWRFGWLLEPKFPSRVNYDSLGLYVTRNGNERFHPWSCIQAGILSYKWGGERINGVVRTMKEEFSFRYPADMVPVGEATVARISDFLKVLEEFTPSESIYRINKRGFIWVEIINVALALAIVLLLSYPLPLRGEVTRFAFGLVLAGIFLWIPSIVSRIKTSFRLLRAPAIFAAFCLANGILLLIAGTVKNQNELPKPLSQEVHSTTDSTPAAVKSQ